MDNRQTTWLGGALIVLGLVWWLKLGWLLLPAALVTGGVIGYQQRKLLGRTREAVQVAYWCFGLGLAFLLHMMVPGILLLIGGSFLLRGREEDVDQWVQAQMKGSAARPAPAAAPSRQQVEITVVPDQNDQAHTGDTQRL